MSGAHGDWSGAGKKLAPHYSWCVISSFGRGVGSRPVRAPRGGGGGGSGMGRGEARDGSSQKAHLIDPIYICKFEQSVLQLCVFII